jgi:isochorismate synthase EntC
MDNLDTDLLILFDESVIKPKLNYLKENYKHNKLFKKLVRLCMQFKIKLYELLEDRFVVKNLEKIIKSCYQRRSDIIEKLAKSINNYNQLEKVVLSRKVKILMKHPIIDPNISSSNDFYTSWVSGSC